jgi:hypothetical protein
LFLYVSTLLSQSRTTRIYLDGRVFRLIIKTQAQLWLF